MDKNGNPIDLSGRKTTYIESAGKGGETISGLQAVLSQEEAAEYTYENVMSGSDEWNPRAYFEPVDRPSNLVFANNQLEWDDIQYAICYIVLRDSIVIDFTTESCYSDETAESGTTYTYQIQAANEYGSLSELSDAVKAEGFVSVEKFIIEQPIVYVSQFVLNARNIEKGSIMTLYSLNGTVQFKEIAQGSEFSKCLGSLRGFYIFKINNKIYKVVF